MTLKTDAILIFERIFEICPDLNNNNWNWYNFSKNPNVTMQFVEIYPDKPWNWEGLTQNPNITPGYILHHPEKPWF